MNRNQDDGAMDTATGKDKKYSGKSGTVLGEINDDARNHNGKPQDKPGDGSNNSRKPDDNDDAVLKDINDKPKKSNQ